MYGFRVGISGEAGEPTTADVGAITPDRRRLDTERPHRVPHSGRISIPCCADPEAFLAQYREVTGFTEEQVNPRVMEYFFILAMAELLVQMVRGADALSRGRPKGIMASFLINSVAYFHEKYLEICTR